MGIERGDLRLFNIIDGIKLNSNPISWCYFSIKIDMTLYP